MCIYVYMNMCVYIYLCVYVHVYVYVYIYMYIYMYSVLPPLVLLFRIHLYGFWCQTNACLVFGPAASKNPGSSKDHAHISAERRSTLSWLGHSFRPRDFASHGGGRASSSDWWHKGREGGLWVRAFTELHVPVTVGFCGARCSDGRQHKVMTTGLHISVSARADSAVRHVTDIWAAHCFS